MKVKIDGQWQDIGGGDVETVNGQTGEVVLDSDTIPMLASEPELGTIYDYIQELAGAIPDIIMGEVGDLSSEFGSLWGALDGVVNDIGGVLEQFEGRIEALEAEKE